MPHVEFAPLKSVLLAMVVSLACLLTIVAACGNPKQKQASEHNQDQQAKFSKLEGEEVTPPFAVKGEAEGLLLVWFDAKGPHTAEKRSEIPEARRQQVRVDSNQVAPDQRLDPEFVYVADLRKAKKSGHYTVRKVPRAQFETWIDAEQGVAKSAEENSITTSSDIVVYRTSWCGACKAAEAFLRKRGVAFVSKDVERDPTARAQMQQKCQAASRRCDGVPVIDFAGQILTGFSEAQLELLIQQRGNKAL